MPVGVGLGHTSCSWAGLDGVQWCSGCRSCSAQRLHIMWLPLLAVKEEPHWQQLRGVAAGLTSSKAVSLCSQTPGSQMLVAWTVLHPAAVRQQPGLHTVCSSPHAHHDGVVSSPHGDTTSCIIAVALPSVRTAAAGAGAARQLPVPPQFLLSTWFQTQRNGGVGAVLQPPYWPAKRQRHRQEWGSI
jgi:hypothetical protein